MRLHITLADELVDELDRRVGPRERSPFIGQAVTRALRDENRWEVIEGALGSIEDFPMPELVVEHWPVGE